MKKVVSILLSLIMIMSVSVYAADSITVNDSKGNEATYYSTKTIWDVQFDSTYAVPTNGGRISKNGVELKLANDLKDFSDVGNMSLDQVTTNVGNSTLNSSTISNDAAVANADHDYFLRLESTNLSAEVDGATKYGYNFEVQMNQMPIRANSGIVVIQNDFAIGKLPTGKNYIRVSHLQFNGGDKASYNNGSFGSVVQVTADGVVKVHTTTTDIKVNVNEWHTVTQVVDFDKKSIDYYIDGEYIGSVQNDNIVLLWKFQTYHPKTGTDELVSYYDNIKVFKATTDVVSIEATDAGDTSFEGAPVTLKTFNFDEDLVKDVKIYSSTDGVNYSLYSDEDAVVAYYKSYTTYYKAMAFDADGNEIGESKPVMLTTNNLKANGITYWNFDFEDNYSLSGGEKGGTIRQNGKDITNPNGKVISTNSGTAGVVKLAEVDTISNNANGTSLVLDNANNSGSEVQINELRMASTDAITVCEFDFAYNKAPEANNSIIRFEGVPVESGDTNRAFESSSMMYLTNKGNVYMNPLGESSGIAVSANEWHHIVQVVNLTTRKIDTYVDGKLLGTTNFSGTTVSGEVLYWKQIRRFSAASGKTNSNALYYDNFNIYSVAASADSALEIDSINYYIDGEAADKIAAGNLTAEVVLSNNNAANNGMQCIVAVYSAPGELERVTLTPVTFTADEVSKLLNLNIGEVSENDSVKIFFWSMGEDTLTPNGANGVLANE